MYWNSLSPQRQDQLVAEQRDREINQVDEGIERFISQVGISGPINSLNKDIIRDSWFVLVQDLMVQKYNIMYSEAKQAGRPGRRVGWYRTALSLPSQRLAMIGLATAFEVASSKDGQPTWMSAGVKVWEAINHDRLIQAVTAKNARDYDNAHVLTDKTPRELRYICTKAGIPLKTDLSSKDQARLGCWLLERVVSATGLFEQGRKFVPNKKPITTLTISPRLAEFMDKRLDNMAHMYPKHEPMITPPVAWEEGVPHGGYYVLQTELVKKTKTYSVAEADPCTTEATNFMQSVPFRVNKVASLTADTIWYNKREGAGLPLSVDEDLPERVEEFTSEEHEKEVMKERSLIHDRNKRGVGKRVSAHMTLLEARNNRDRGAIWFPHNVDFRSRLYSSACPVSPQGCDYSRGLLEFADALPIGERGLYWLKVQLANTFGVDKVSFDDRVAWSDELMTELARREFDPLDWSAWEDADKPFDALATAHELHTALSMDNPYNFKSFRPIAMDGSCNGLQHLSAMGRDSIAGREVNLLDTVIPGDIYSMVMNSVIRTVEAERHSCELAAAWHGNVKRKTVKRGVMTTPYGVTMRGIRDQLVVDGFTKNLVSDMSEIVLATYLARKIDDGISDVFGPGKAIMTWLQESTSMSLKASNKPMEWNCPLGFGVIQHYVAPKTNQIKVELPSGPAQIALRTWNKDKLDIRKGRNSIAPNFVHSMDAAHQMATVLSLKDQGVEHYLGIHDSFAVHACHVDMMHEAIREQFVTLHETEPLAQFKADNEARLGITLPDLPERGGLNIGDVRNSTYLFS